MRFRLIGLIGVLAFLVSFITFAEPGNAQAALTLNNFTGFETNGLDEASASMGTPTIQGGTVHSGDFAVQLDTSADNYDIAMITGGSTDSNDDFILGFFIRFADKTPASADTILSGRDDSTNTLWSLALEADGDISFRDEQNGLIGSTIADPFTLNVWHLIEVRWQHLGSGAFDAHIDSSSEVSETGIDLSAGGTIGENSAFYQLLGNTGADFFFDDFYMYSGGTGTGDFLGDAEVFRYQNRENSTTSDSSTCVSLSNNLDQGVWQDVGETPLGVDSGVEPAFQANGDGGLIFTDDTASGDNGRHGPHGDANIDGDSNIRGAKWLHRLRRGNGGSDTQSLCFGNDADSVSSTAISLDTSFLNFFTISVSASEQPLSTEHFSQGMHTAAARDIEGEEFWSFILHVPDTGVARRIFPVQ